MHWKDTIQNMKAVLHFSQKKTAFLAMLLLLLPLLLYNLTSSHLFFIYTWGENIYSHIHFYIQALKGSMQSHF